MILAKLEPLEQNEIILQIEFKSTQFDFKVYISFQSLFDYLFKLDLKFASTLRSLKWWTKDLKLLN